jgi:hypothetical protein
MQYRNLLLATALASGLTGFAACAVAETIAVGNEIEVMQSNVATPTRGMTMQQVSSKFGAPVSKVPAVGNPPISRWEYPGFVVYFQSDFVIHSVVSDAPAPSNS